MFNKKTKKHAALQPPTINFEMPSMIITQDIEYRPCYVNGRRALFHRWVNSANPVLPKGMDPDDERARFYQHRSTTGMVEYSDGTVARVWPQEIRFADSAARFREYAWETDGQRSEETQK